MDNQAGLQAKQRKSEYDRNRRNNPEYREKMRNRRRDNPEVSEREREYKKTFRNKPGQRERENEYHKIYRQTPTGKKNSTKQDWKRNGMIFTAEEFERIYNLYLTQELCNACDVKLTRGGMYMTNTKACCDHDHENGLFRHIICNSCNVNDNWKKHFC